MQENDAQAASDGDWMHGGGAVHETFYLYLVEGLFHGHKSNDKDCSAKKKGLFYTPAAQAFWKGLFTATR
eukprot:scaffold28026_cov125-Skeletonema_dohrnii-CCMP3373.AAC.2